MKTIIIESVSNGWIVTDRFACRNVAQEPVAVYNHIGDLQGALPGLLGIAATDPHAAVGYPAPMQFIACGASTPSNNKYSTSGLPVNPPPLADRDSDGGNTGL